MWTSPSTNDLIEGILVSLNKDIAPELQSYKAQATLGMIQVLLQCIAQRVPVEQQLMVTEHNQMTATLRDTAVLLGEAPGPAADRIRQRARDLGARADLPEIPPSAEITSVHRELSNALVRTLEDLDELLRNGNGEAEKALLRLREHLGPRSAQEFAVYVAGAGMVGRG